MSAAPASPITLLPSLSTTTDPVGTALRDVIAIFTDDLAEVRFPDIDGAVLSAAAGAVEDVASDVARLEAALEEARRHLDDAHDVLTAKAARGVAYARVFAIGDDDLMGRLDAITLPRSRGRSTPAVVAAAPTKRRGRPRSQPPTDTLFAGPVLVDDDASASADTETAAVED